MELEKWIREHSDLGSWRIRAFVEKLPPDWHEELLIILEAVYQTGRLQARRDTVRILTEVRR